MATSSEGFGPSASALEGTKEQFRAIGTVAVLAIGLSVLFLIVGLPKVWGFFQRNSDPAGGPFQGFMFAAFLVGFFGLGCVGIGTGIGLYFLWRWARVSILIFSVLVPYFFVMLLITFLADPSFFKPGDGLPYVFGVTIFVLAMGIWCFSYFTRTSVKRLF